MKILIVDDHKLFTEGLVLAFSHRKERDFKCFVASTVEAGLDILKQQPGIEVVLLDLYFPKEEGNSFLKDAEAYDCQVIILSSSTNIYDIKQAMDAGARGYISKESSIDYVIESIDKVMRDEISLPVEIRRGLEKFKSKEGKENRELEQAGLTMKQYNVLRLMANGLSNQQISEVLNVNIETVRTHAKKIYAALKVNNRMNAVNEAKRLGILRN